MRYRKIDYIIFFIFAATVYVISDIQALPNLTNIKDIIALVIGTSLGMLLWIVIPGTITNLIFKKRSK